MLRREDQRGGMLISVINGQPAAHHFLARFLQDAGFHLAPHGLNFRRALLPAAELPGPLAAEPGNGVSSKVQ
jgi:hypothetical protein